ncbi:MULTISPECIES: bifunctional biotin--[acetyl-CoA-carboxylase] ligase/biotin operon repressor BirA [Idiomarina]|nr:MULTISPECIES: bifunctional biotin--[acetyl-CoA-carboxylase] ligase/biotin operon repressor BirA [Idiomarina]MBL73739.1 bifunctional biotin--[acetyl-CoA-carboxylase] synthetase/biotin operon repressor [Idiomarinaceae bacterium]
MKIEQRLEQLIKLLNDGEFHSGESLGQAMSVSRAAINQYIERLDALGIDVFSVSGKGYRLASSIELLNAEQIAATSELPESMLNVSSIVGSTNDDLKQLSDTQQLPQGYAILAEAQTQGRGRRGKQWISPFGTNLYISLYWRLEEGLGRAMGLSLAVGLAIARVLREQLNISNVSVKWPNDVYIENKKVAGILIDIDSLEDGSARCVIGVGINLTLPDTVAQSIDQAWTDVNSHLALPLQRNRFAGRLHQYLVRTLTDYENSGFGQFATLWREYDKFDTKPVRLLLGERKVDGLCRGVDETGALLVEVDGSVKRFFGGEISVRPGDATSH